MKPYHSEVVGIPTSPAIITQTSQIKEMTYHSTKHLLLHKT